MARADEAVWSSGEICEVTGTYASRCCREMFTKKFMTGDIFSFCPHCRKKMKWRRALFPTLEIDTAETGAKNGSPRRYK